LVGILLVTHNGLGYSFADCVGHVFGKIPSHIKTLSVLAEDDPEQKFAEGVALLEELDTGKGVLILVDVFGATPCNIARRLCKIGQVRGVAGLNLPMLLRVVGSTKKSLPELAKLALEGGRECIVDLAGEDEKC
jgi:PTS system ascorbate-specific IIA component